MVPIEASNTSWYFSIFLFSQLEMSRVRPPFCSIGYGDEGMLLVNRAYVFIYLLRLGH
jgi:hypothetical protein